MSLRASALVARGRPVELPTATPGITSYESVGASTHATLPSRLRSRPFLAFVSRCAMVAAVIRTPFDQSGKQMVRDVLEGRYSVESDAELAVAIEICRGSHRGTERR
jgi:hypothetical protein